jgi:hypothetical protein
VAASTLTLTRDDLRKAVGNLLGLGIDITSWDSEFATRVDMVVDIGCRWVYEPELIPGDAEVHVWSFMQPKLLSFSLNQPYATGTCTVSSGVVTGDGTVFPSWAADGEFVVGSISYAVASRDSDTQLTLEDTTVSAAAGSSYTLQQVDYTLPDLFGGFHGDLYLNQTNTSLGYILERASKEELLQLQKSGIADFASQPARYAVFAKDQTGARGSEVADYGVAASGRGLHNHRVLCLESVSADILLAVPDGWPAVVRVPARSGVSGG